MIVGMHVGYTIRVIMRSDNPALYDDHKGIKKMLSTLTFPAWISIFVWGFANLPWYVVIIWFLVCALLITPIVFKGFFLLITISEVIFLLFMIDNALAASSFLSIVIGFFVITSLTGKDLKSEFF